MFDPRQKTLRIYHFRLNRALHYIDQHIDQELSLRVISRAAGFSQYHFHRIFSSLIGETLNDYVRRLRLERAAIKLLHNPFRSITEIALDCGFSSSSNFARAFKEHFGMPASRWREEGHEKHRVSKIRETVSNKRKPVGNNGEETLPDYGYDSGVELLTVKEHEMKVEVKQMSETHIAYVRHMRGYQDTQGLREAWDKICKWAGAHDFIGPKTLFIGISHDDPEVTPVDKCRTDACVTVPAGTRGSGEVKVTALPAGKYAVFSFEGKPEEIKGAYNFVYGKWLPESGYQPVDSPCYEIYRNEPDKDPEGKHIFDICLPVKPL